MWGNVSYGPESKYATAEPAKIDSSTLERSSSSTLPSSEELRAFIMRKNAVARRHAGYLLEASQELTKKMASLRGELRTVQAGLAFTAAATAGNHHQPAPAKISLSAAKDLLVREEDTSDAGLARLSHDELMVLATHVAAIIPDAKLATMDQMAIICTEFEREEKMMLAWLAGKGNFNMWWGSVPVSLDYIPGADRTAARDHIVEKIKDEVRCSGVRPDEFKGYSSDMFFSHEAQMVLASVEDCWDLGDELIGVSNGSTSVYNDEGGYTTWLEMAVPCLFIKRK
jgi:hypothetical protein